MGFHRWKLLSRDQHASRAHHGEDRVIGRSRGGATTKIHLAFNVHGHPINFEITGGEVHAVHSSNGSKS